MKKSQICWKKRRHKWRATLSKIADFQRSFQFTAQTLMLNFFLITFCLCTWTETLVKVDHHPGGDNRMSYKEKKETKECWQFVWVKTVCPARHMKLHNVFRIISVRSRNIFKNYNGSANLVLGGIKFRNYGIRSNPNKPTRGSGVIWNV